MLMRAEKACSSSADDRLQNKTSSLYSTPPTGLNSGALVFLL
jgi:hypothetical protein